MAFITWPATVNDKVPTISKNEATNGKGVNPSGSGKIEYISCDIRKTPSGAPTTKATRTVHEYCLLAMVMMCFGEAPSTFRMENSFNFF